jgi:DNA repair exonuclease SbcCD ATPase subunit
MAKSSATKNRRPPVVSKPAEPPADSGGVELEEITLRHVGAKNQQAKAIRESEVLADVAGLSMDSVSATLASTQVEVQKSLADLSAKLVDQLQRLKNVEEAIQLKQEELKQLYNIETKEVELDDLQAEIAKQREEWEEEQARKAREHEEQRSERTKQWRREEEEYKYELAMKQRKEEDVFKQKMEDQAKANRNKQEQLEKNWAEREAVLKKSETEFAELKAKVEAMPEAIKKAENAAVAVATNSVKKEYETKATLVQKDLEMFQKLAAQEAGSLKQALEKANAEINSIKAQLDQARADMKEISTKALESASGRDAMSAMQKVMEREPTSKQGK